MSRSFEYKVAPESEGERIDLFLRASLGNEGSEFSSISRTRIQSLIEDGRVKINHREASKNERISAGDYITLNFPDLMSTDVRPQKICLDVVYEDEDLIVVNKPRGMVVHPAAGNPDGTLVNALLYHCSSLSGINGVLRPGIVHRIDKDTSGLLVVAKNDRAHLSLAEQFACHSVTRVYHAILRGVPRETEGTVCSLIGRDPKDRKRFASDVKIGKPAITHYQVLNVYHGYTHCALKLETGRTHQIRVHMASIGCPVAGDPIYRPDKKESFLNGQCLHAKTLGFDHPSAIGRMEFDSELPDYFADFISLLEKKVCN